MLDLMNSSLRGRLSRSLRCGAAALATAQPSGPAIAPLADDELGTLDPMVPPWPCSPEQVAGVRLNVRYDNNDAAPGVVYVHGLGGSATNWTDLQALLAPTASGAAIDLPGFGFSVPPSGFDFTLVAHARVLEQYLERLGAGPVHLVGNSMGGAIVLLTAARRPELVRTLTLVSPAMPDRRPDPRRLSDPRLAVAYLPVLGKPVRHKLAQLGPRDRVRRMIELCFADPSRLPQQRFDEMVDELATVERQGWSAAALAHSTADIFQTWLRSGPNSLWSVARRVEAPTLVLWGEQDKLISVRRAAPTARALPRGRLMRLAETGHVAQMERPETVARAILGLWQHVSVAQWSTE